MRHKHSQGENVESRGSRSEVSVRIGRQGQFGPAPENKSDWASGETETWSEFRMIRICDTVSLNRQLWSKWVKCQDYKKKRSKLFE